MTDTSICAIKVQWNLPNFLPLHLFVHTIFLSIHCHYTSYLICHV